MAGARAKTTILTAGRWLLACVAMLACVATAAEQPVAAVAKKPARLALVIGNGAYKDAPLPNPLNDAADMARALEASGFTVIKRENATLREMHLALREFGDRLGRTTTGLVYFAGHGVQVRGRNYLVPVDADIAREDEVAFMALDVSAVMEKLDSAKNPVNIVVLDACRNNPFEKRFALSRGLAPIDAPPGTLIAFATAPGSTAADGTGRNGVFTQYLVEAMQKPGASVEEVFKATRAGVRTATKGEQTPWESTSLETPFAFRAAPKPKVEAPAGSIAALARSKPLGTPPEFAKGDSWTFRVVNRMDNSERVMQYFVDDIRDDGVRFSNGTVTDLQGNATRVQKSGGGFETFTPSTLHFVFPLKKGASWTRKGEQVSGDRTFDLVVKLKVVGEEEITVPAGKLRALRLEREVKWVQRNSKRHGTNTQVYWYNAGLKRPVALDARNVTSDGKTLLDERYELAAVSLK